MAIVLPNTFTDGTNSIGFGKQVMENLEALKAALDPMFGTGVWTVLTARAKATAFQVSATRPGYVFLQVATPEGGVQHFNAHVAGIELPEIYTPVHTGKGGWTDPYGPFPVRPAETWEWQSSLEHEPTSVLSSYLVL